MVEGVGTDLCPFLTIHAPELGRLRKAAGMVIRPLRGQAWLRGGAVNMNRQGSSQSPSQQSSGSEEKLAQASGSWLLFTDNGNKASFISVRDQNTCAMIQLSYILNYRMPIMNLKEGMKDGRPLSPFLGTMEKPGTWHRA